jgi:hypothetical protein
MPAVKQRQAGQGKVWAIFNRLFSLLLTVFLFLSLLCFSRKA